MGVVALDGTAVKLCEAITGLKRESLHIMQMSYCEMFPPLAHLHTHTHTHIITRPRSSSHEPTTSTHAHPPPPPPPPRGSSASHPQTVNQLLPIHRELRLPAASAATHTAANPCWQVEDVTLSFDSAASHNNIILFIFKVSGRARRPSFTPRGIGWETVQILR